MLFSYIYLFWIYNFVKEIAFMENESITITKEEQEFLDKNRIQTFRVYHVRTLASILQLIKTNKKDEAIKYIQGEISSIKNIKNNEFAQFMDALTLKLALKDKNNDKNDSGA
jgi:hypothetical protein